MNVPAFVLESPSLAAAAVRAAFDAEGSVSGRKRSGVSITTRRITITNISEDYLKSIRRALRSFSIASRIYCEEKPTRNIFRLAIYHQDNLRRFADIIKPYHPKRMARLTSVLRSYRKDRISELSLRIPVLRSISNGNCTRRQIAASLGLANSRVGNQLYKLRKQHLVAKPTLIWTNRGGCGVYRLTVKGERALRGFIDTAPLSS